MDDFTLRVSMRAYEIWEKQGRPDGLEHENWLEAESEIRAEMEKAGPDSETNQGEGNRTAAKAYNRGATAFAKSGRVEKQAREAEASIEGPEAASLQAAEDAGRQHSHGEDPAVRH